MTSDFIFLVSKINVDTDCSHEIKRHLLLGRVTLTTLDTVTRQRHQSCLALRDPMDCSMPGFLVLHHLQEFAQMHIRLVGDAIQPSHPLSEKSEVSL